MQLAVDIVVLGGVALSVAVSAFLVARRSRTWWAPMWPIALLAVVLLVEVLVALGADEADCLEGCGILYDAPTSLVIAPLVAVWVFGAAAGRLTRRASAARPRS